jgi:hypothetical protein
LGTVFGGCGWGTTFLKRNTNKTHVPQTLDPALFGDIPGTRLEMVLVLVVLAIFLI